jgi:hypothetical protein
MPTFVTAAHPALNAEWLRLQIELGCTYREPAHQGKRVLFVSGSNTDVALRDELLFPLTKFVPWAAYVRLRGGTNFPSEQDALLQALTEQPAKNADPTSFHDAIMTMVDAKGVELPSVQFFVEFVGSGVASKYQQMMRPVRIHSPGH